MAKQGEQQPTKRPLKGPRMTKEERRAKYTEIAKKRRQKQQDQHKKKLSICFHCRQRGHIVADCPSKSDSEIGTSICYKCGSTEHALATCPKRNDGKPSDLPFASCFLCKGKGHLIAQCPQNQKGIYVNGGQCRNCGSRKHLVSKCPEQSKSKSKAPKVELEGSDDIEELLEQETPRIVQKSKENSKRKSKVVNF